MCNRISEFLDLKPERVIRESKVREIFTPHAPVGDRALFFGRDGQLESVLRAMDTPGEHAALYGERGVGKSSLANVVAMLVETSECPTSVFRFRCDSDSTFESLFFDLLGRLNYAFAPCEMTYVRAEGGKAELRVPIARAGVDTRRTTSTKTELPTISITPSLVACALSRESGLLIVDEFDAIRCPQVRGRFAEVMKQLSDERSPFKILTVGIATSRSDLLAGHPSVQRCVKDVKLDTMRNEEIAMVIRGGASRAQLKFDDDVVEKITDLSGGYPYFTHLLCLGCAEHVLVNNRRNVTLSDLDIARQRAVADAEGTLRDCYDAAVRSCGMAIYREVLQAASILGPEFTTGQLRTVVRGLLARELRDTELHRALSRFACNDASTLLKRVARGTYRFSDPRMRSFVRICHVGEDQSRSDPLSAQLPD